MIKTIPAKINYISWNLYNILGKDEKRARVDETKTVKKSRRARTGKLSKRVRTCDRKSLKHFV